MVQLENKKGNTYTKNSSVDQINDIISQELLPGEANILFSAESTTDPRDSTRFPVELLNKFTPAGLPTHLLYIKKGMVLMLLRNKARTLKLYMSHS